MGILDKFKKKAEPEKAEKKDKPEEISEKPVKAKADTGQAYLVLARPIISEKSTKLAHEGKYVFEVHRRANKSEIRKSIQKVYDVHVENVRIVNLPGKSRRYGKTRGKTSAWKKAVITVKEGEKIPGIIEAVG